MQIEKCEKIVCTLELSDPSLARLPVRDNIKRRI